MLYKLLKTTLVVLSQIPAVFPFPAENTQCCFPLMAEEEGDGAQHIEVTWGGQG